MDFTVFKFYLRVYPRMEWTISVFAFPAEAVPRLTTPEGWKAELASVPRTTTWRIAVSCSNRQASLGKWVKQQAYCWCPEREGQASNRGLLSCELYTELITAPPEVGVGWVVLANVQDSSASLA